ncbi:MAG: Mpo1-like protein [Candidatus Neomarinimicrobiota bacterium]|nr:Mpo1-like protein [Candidatus Neomarinimicrobiota bacterium]
MKSVNNWLEEYGESHQNPLNKKIHWICVPGIMFSVLGLLWSIPNSYMPFIFDNLQLNWAIIITTLILIYYVKLSPVMAIGMFIIGFLLLAGNFYINIKIHTPLWKISIMIFVVAWIGQFIGHKIEGKKPSFFQDLQFLLIGPAWLLSFIYDKLGIKY